MRFVFYLVIVAWAALVVVSTIDIAATAKIFAAIQGAGVRISHGARAWS